MLTYSKQAPLVALAMANVSSYGLEPPPSVLAAALVVTGASSSHAAGYRPVSDRLQALVSPLPSAHSHSWRLLWQSLSA